MRGPDLRQELDDERAVEAGLAVGGDHRHQRVGDEPVRLVGDERDARADRGIDLRLALHLLVDEVDDEVADDRGLVLAELVQARVDDEHVAAADELGDRQVVAVLDEPPGVGGRADQRPDLVGRRLHPLRDVGPVVGDASGDAVEEVVGGPVEVGEHLARLAGGAVPRVWGVALLLRGPAVGGVVAAPGRRFEHRGEHLDRADEALALRIDAVGLALLFVLPPGDRHRTDRGALDDVLRGPHDLPREEVQQHPRHGVGDTRELTGQRVARPARFDSQWRHAERRLLEVEVPDALELLLEAVAAEPVGDGHLADEFVGGVAQQPARQRPLHVQHDRAGGGVVDVVERQTAQHRRLARPLAAGHDDVVLAVHAGDEPRHARERAAQRDAGVRTARPPVWERGDVARVGVKRRLGQARVDGGRRRAGSVDVAAETGGAAGVQGHRDQRS
ncbi:unannotated protein [freshwater metagenome]|uniref:Unannotated protein n=1 Tax=freshwater metagenome TaxID=449393 RepID=A0A6J7GC18_9ZZZZ